MKKFPFLLFLCIPIQCLLAQCNDGEIELWDNCYGIEKVNRIKEEYDLDEFKNIYVYGNSKGDREMLNLGTHKFYKYFN